LSPTGAGGDGDGALSGDLLVRDEDVATVRRIAGGDDESLRQLFRRYAPNANALALRLLRQPFLAEEAVQDAFVGVWKRAAAYDPRWGSVRSWVMSMVHNRAVDLVRREESQRRRAVAAANEDVVVIADHADDVVRRVSASDDRERVRTALEGLPEDQRRVIELMYFGGMSQSAIAERLAIPLGTVKSRSLLGIRRLRDGLAGMER
jgi:RNA polymerase sigma-70 factor (ECF subfamily)